MISDDCHSFLHITLANGIPPRKAMVMAGENAANDVDLEAHAMTAPRGTRLKKLQLATDEQSPTRIKLNSLTFLVKRELQEHYVLLNRPQTLRGWHTTRHTFHLEVGAHSVLPVADEVLRTDEWCRTRRRILCRSSSGGREQNSAMHDVRGNAQW